MPASIAASSSEANYATCANNCCDNALFSRHAAIIAIYALARYKYTRS